ncbi:MAG: hypothetical protein NT003_03185 [Candidatus Magasanikbacteria bacterium]|nr:hypothetical protein [Candidatus Magasanikbacteria bacterium]
MKTDSTTKPNHISLDLSRVDEPPIDLKGLATRETASFDTLIGPMLNPPRKSDMRNTRVLMNRLADNPHYTPPSADCPDAPYGVYLDRRIAGFDTRVTDSVYMGHSPREALVIDPRPEGEIMRLYRKFRWLRLRFMAEYLWQHRARMNRGIMQREQLFLLMRFVQDEMPFDKHRAERLVAEYNAKNDVKLTLDVFIRARAGVCRHQVCLYAVLVELLQEHGHMGGKVSLQRGKFYRMSHAWVRFTSEWGQIYIIDPAQDRFGNIAEMGEHERDFYSI